MTRNEILEAVKLKAIQTPRPPHMMKTSELEEILNRAFQTAVQVVATPKMKDRILELGKQGFTKTQIFLQMQAEGFSKVRYGYVLLVLKQAELVVPKQQKVKKVLEVVGA